MQRRGQSESIKVAQQRVLVRVLSIPGWLADSQGQRSWPAFGCHPVTGASLPGLD